MSHKECPTLTEALESAGITKIELAEKLGVSRKTVTRMGDTITPEVVRVLAECTISVSLDSAVTECTIGVPYSIDTGIGKPVVTDAQPPPFKWQDKPESMFDGKGRGVPVDGFVMVARKYIKTDGFTDTVHGVVTQQDWLARLKYKCPHDYKGWTCKKCLH